MSRIFICRFIDGKPYVIYKINVDMPALIEDKSLIKEYVKEIKEDDNKSLLTFMTIWFRKQIEFRKLVKKNK